jgi:4-amino-4-deoxy-L-arabinose transferase-like glycosyltransferase
MKQLLDLLRRNWLFFLAVTLAALALRLFFVFFFSVVEGDSLIYGDIAKNWLSHGMYGVTDGAMVRPTLIRLPGYPAFLAAVFSVFGREHYTAVMVVQALLDVNSCLVIAAMALELMDQRVAKAAYLLAALCPFTANYTATPLTETLTIFCTAHALYYGVRGVHRLQAGEPAPGSPDRAAFARAGVGATRLWLVAGLWTGAAMLLRPDSGLLLAALGLPLLFLLFRQGQRATAAMAGMALLAASLLPLVPWTVRNWRTFHSFQPLAPRYANDPGEFVPQGFNRWVKTWTVDFVSVSDVYWKVTGEPVDFHLLPERAFDSRQEFETTQDLIARYNQQVNVDPDLDAAFEQLAQQRIRRSLFRYYIWLPSLRVASMWLRPRTEFLPLDARWWEFRAHPQETAFAVAWAGVNLFFLLAAFRGWREWPLGLAGFTLVAFIVIRSVFLGTLENPEPRYVLECFPALLALAGGAFAQSPDTDSIRKPGTVAV